MPRCFAVCFKSILKTWIQDPYHFSIRLLLSLILRWNHWYDELQVLKHKSSKSCSPFNIAHPSPSVAWSCRNGSPFYRIQIMGSEFYHKAFGTSGARLTKAYDVTIQRYRNSHVKKIKTIKCIFCGIWVQSFMLNFTQKYEPMHCKICIFEVLKLDGF